jgi:hypothetical protein
VAVSCYVVSHIFKATGDTMLKCFRMTIDFIISNIYHSWRLRLTFCSRSSRIELFPVLISADICLMLVSARRYDYARLRRFEHSTDEDTEGGLNKMLGASEKCEPTGGYGHHAHQRGHSD